MVIDIEGAIRLPDGMSEDDFNVLFFDFLEEHGLSFGGVTSISEEE